jgi:hypothetical protein
MRAPKEQPPEPSDEEYEAAKAWLAEHFPGAYRDPLAVPPVRHDVHLLNPDAFHDYPGEPWNPRTVQEWQEAAAIAARNAVAEAYNDPGLR